MTAQGQVAILPMPCGHAIGGHPPTKGAHHARAIRTAGTVDVQGPAGGDRRDPRRPRLPGPGRVHLTHGTFDAQLTSPSDYLNDSAFAAGLALSIPGILTMGAVTRARAATALAVVGQLLVLVGVAAGQSPAWFAAVGLPGNLLAWVGLTMLAWRVRRTSALPIWVAILMVLAVPLGLLLAEIGGTIVPAALWIAVGSWLLRTTPDPARRQPGTAPLVSAELLSSRLGWAEATREATAAGRAAVEPPTPPAGTRW